MRLFQHHSFCCQIGLNRMNGKWNFLRNHFNQVKGLHKALVFLIFLDMSIKHLQFYIFNFQRTHDVKNIFFNFFQSKFFLIWFTFNEHIIDFPSSKNPEISVYKIYITEQSSKFTLKAPHWRQYRQARKVIYLTGTYCVQMYENKLNQPKQRNDK